MEGIRLTGSSLATKSSPKFLFLASELQTNAAEADPTLHSDDDVALETLPRDDNESLATIPEEGEVESDAEDQSDNSLELKNVADGAAIVANGASACSSLFPDLSSEKQVLLTLLEDCIENNPVASLNIHYMKRGVQENFKSSFREESLNVVGRPNIYRTCEFTCPLSGSVYHSSLPLCLLGKDSNEKLVQLVKKAFGEYQFLENGRVAFSTKKGAKRCVAMVALHELARVSDITNGNGSEGTARADVKRSDGLQVWPPFEKYQKTKPVLPAQQSSSIVLEQELNRRAKFLKRIKSKQQAIPEWVHDLHRFGIRASNLKISYKGEAINAGWDCTRPTLLQCVLEIDEPIACTISGSPQPSKQCALESAVVELGNHLRRLNLIDKTKHSDHDLEAKQHLLACDSTIEVSYASIPAWCNDKLLSKECSDTHTIWHLYKLEFVATCGTSFVSERSGLDESIANPLGIVFPRDVSPIEFVIDPQQSGAMKGVTLRVSKLGTVLISESRRGWLTEFNRTLDHWKRYGRDEVMRLNGKIVDNLQSDTSPPEYTYYFVPLMNGESNQIDWNLLEKVSTKKCRPYMEPIQWRMLCRDLLVTTLYLATLLGTTFLTSSQCPEMLRMAMDSSTALFGGMAVLLSLLATAAMLKFLSIQRHLLMQVVLSEIVTNHFLVQKSVNNCVYVTSDKIGDVDDNWTGFSIMPKTQETYADYYKSRYHVQLSYPNKALIPCRFAISFSNHDFLLHNEPIGNAAYLIPELVWLLPMPRHYLYLARHIEKCMSQMEREIELAFASKVIESLAEKASDNTSAVTPTLSSLVAEATTLAPKPTYQRLEFFGDSVLGFYCTIVLFSMNSELNMTFDDIGASLEECVKNDALFSAALSIGANRLLSTNQRQRKWRTEHTSDDGRELIPDSIMSDTVESLLGATFLHDVTFKDSNASVALFETLRLPISSGNSAINQNVSICNVISSCLDGGYPFQKDIAWEKQLTALNERVMIADQETAKELKEKHDALVAILDKLSEHNIASLDESYTDSILLNAALFHADEVDGIDDSGNESNDTDNGFATANLPRLSRFRDMLFFVGAYALQLCITTELFQRFPDINEGGLHLLRARAIADDIVVYIMFKAGIHKTVYKLDDEIVEEFEAMMIKADTLGLYNWNARGGWVLPGGTEEFVSRRRMSPSQTPQYPGFAGGRLVGSKRKLYLIYTEEPMFAMKAIIGALVLSSGMECMWECIGPLFEEVLLLSPEETLQAFPESTIK